MAMRYGVSTVVAGATSSGKTTLLNALLSTIPDNKRVFTIESGARELSLVRRNRSGAVVNNVVHTLSRPSDNEAFDYTQEDLVVASLRFNPDLVIVGEIGMSNATPPSKQVLQDIPSLPPSTLTPRTPPICVSRFCARRSSRLISEPL